MATLHITFDISGKAQSCKANSTRETSLLLKNEVTEHPDKLSVEIWDSIVNTLKMIGNVNQSVNKDSVAVSIDTDDNKHIDVPKEVILKCFEPQYV